MATGVVKTILNIFGYDSSNFAYISAGFTVLMGILFVINIFGTKFLELVSNISTIGKLLALITAILAGLIIVIISGQNNFSQVQTVTSDVTSNMDLQAVIMAIIAAFYAFTGFESVASGSEDMNKPEKNLPKAIPLCIIDPVSMIEKKEVVALVAVFKNPIIKSIILYGSLLSMFGINVAASIHTPRIIESVILLIKFNWVKQFTVDNEGIISPNYLTIISMIVGYVIIPLFVYVYNKKKLKN